MGNWSTMTFLSIQNNYMNLLDAGSDACGSMERQFPTQMSKFDLNSYLKKGRQGPGCNFNGHSIYYILREESPIELENRWPTFASAYISYLKSIRELHKVLTAEELSEHRIILNEFRVHFNYLCWVWSQHDPVGIILTGPIRLSKKQTLNSQKTTHSTLKIFERKHNFRVNRVIATPKSQEKSLKSIVWHNSKKAGFTPPSRFKKTNSPIIVFPQMTNQ